LSERRKGQEPNLFSYFSERSIVGEKEKGVFAANKKALHQPH